MVVSTNRDGRRHAMATYKVVAFMGLAKPGTTADNISAQLESLINLHARDGWQLDQIQAVNIQVKPGCLAAFFGAKEVYVKHDQVVFRR
jgi:hypothetical protein